MKPLLSILDPSPLFAGQTSSAALADSLTLAGALDGSAWRSYWVQEHHNTQSFAGTAPEVLIAALGQRTAHLTLGSGGVMLPNYSPLKVAEQFCTLEALFPGRIELGIGRATGADPRTSAALLGPGAQAFPGMMRLLMDWLLDASGEGALGPDHRAQGIHVRPSGARPDLWMLCSSPESAAFAGAIGVKLAFADFLNPGGAAAALAAYRTAFRPSPFAARPHGAIGLVALAARDAGEAEWLATPGLAWNSARLRGGGGPFPPAEEAARQVAAIDTAERLGIASRNISGAPDEVASRIMAVCESAGSDEVFVLTITEHINDRIKSYRLIEAAMAAA